jgi:general secretion pathway protein A
MFTEYFQFHTQPFAEYTSAERLWPDDRLTQGLARLQYVATQGTLGLVTGDSGVGKSALAKRFLSDLGKMQGPSCQAYYLHLANLSSIDLLKRLVSLLGEFPEWTKELLLMQVADRAAQVHGSLLVLLDEAHLLRPHTLTDLRLLVSYALDDHPMLRLVLIGQPRLLELLRQQRDMLDRITVRYHVHPLSKPQTAEYLDFHVRTAGGDPALFEPAVKELIHDYTGGVPRQINNVATACLLQAAARKAAHVDEDLLQQTLSEFHLP